MNINPFSKTQFSSSASLLRFLTVLVSVLFFASSSFANPNSRASSLTCVITSNQIFVISRAGTTVAKIGVTISSRAGLLAEALNDITKTSIRGGARTLEEIFIALKGTGSVLQDVVEAATRCNACISRTQTAMRGLNKTLGLKSKEALEKISDWARKFSGGVKEGVDDFVYSTLNVCVGSSPSAKVVEWCEQYANWKANGRPSGQKPLVPQTCDLFNSFAGTTKVLTRTGLVAIASLSIGSEVFSFNEITKTDEYQKITATYQHVDKKLTDLTLEVNGKFEIIETTPEHPFYVSSPTKPNLRPAPLGHSGLSNSWVGAGHLKAGDVIRRSNGLVGKVRKVVNHVGSRKMYNLTVDKTHTFFVGQKHWLVHNCKTFRLGKEIIATAFGERLAGVADELFLKIQGFFPRRNVTVATTEIDGVIYVTMNANADARALNNVYDEVIRLKSSGKKYEWIHPASVKGLSKDELRSFHAERRLYEALQEKGLKVEEIGISGRPCGFKDEINNCQIYFNQLLVTLNWSGIFK
jgi:hypothetical protein